MSDELASADHGVELFEPARPLTLRQMMGRPTLREHIAAVRAGLRQPKTLGEYKFAMHQVLRVWSPTAGVVLPILLMLAVILAPEKEPAPPVICTVNMLDPSHVVPLDEESKVPEPPQPMDGDFKFADAPTVNSWGEPNDTFLGATPGPVAADADAGEALSPQPPTFDAIARIKSRILMPGMISNRAQGARVQALLDYGSGDGAGTKATEGAIYLALRWLKKNQNQDGSWSNVKPAMTGLALLTFLAHGETPSPACEEFGSTVERAIRWLVLNQQADGTFSGSDGHNYSHPIATYALCEAFVLTKIPMVKDAAEKAVALIIKGQNATGGWDYNMKPSERDDTSYMGWCAQALKAAKLAGLHVEGLEPAIKKAMLGFKKNYGSNENGGYFGYTSPANSGLTGTGALCMQLLGASKSQEVKEALHSLGQATYNWAGDGVYNNNYYWYYITQAKFHEGGTAWNAWNKLFSPVLVKNQTVISKAIADPKGNMVDIGFWDMTKETSGHTDGPVMNTCLCALQLQVYYRYLPTFKTPDAVEEGPSSLSDKDKDVDIQIL